MRQFATLGIATSFIMSFAACSSSTDSTPSATVPADGGATFTTAQTEPQSAGDPQTPATGSSATIEAWLAQGSYKTWHCETAPHAARLPSPHGVNRICSNDLSSTHTTGPYPVGAANVKELYADDMTTIIGYAVELHTSAATTPESWYWYERNPAALGTMAPTDGVAGVVADGLPLNKAARESQVCVSCHSAAGSDTVHFGHDFVYRQVQ